MEYIEAVNKIDTKLPKLFLAGAITGAPDWQKEMIAKLSDLDIAILNPRRANFPIGDPSAAEEQIKWEHNALRAADVISFWFCKETICPIGLYELGAWTILSNLQGTPIIIGVEPGYQRKQDIEIQTRLANKRILIVESLDDLIRNVRVEFSK